MIDEVCHGTLRGTSRAKAQHIKQCDEVSTGWPVAPVFERKDSELPGKFRRNFEGPLERNSNEGPVKDVEFRNQDGFLVTLREEVMIPPMSQVVCQATLRRASRVKAQHIVIEQCEEALSGLLVARVLCKKDNVVPVRLLNITEKELTLRSRSVIARAYEAEIEQAKKKEETLQIRSIDQKGVKEILEKLNLDNPKSSDEQRLKQLVLEFIDVFKAPEDKLSCTTEVVHRIITEDVQPIIKRPYRVPYHRQEVMKQEIQKLLDDGVIVESESPWSFPAILIEKKRHPGEDIQYRLVIDYRELNTITKTDYFPLPNIQETIEKLAGSHLFSTMELAAGYFQVPIQPEDQEKTAFLLLITITNF